MQPLPRRASPCPSTLFLRKHTTLPTEATFPFPLLHPGCSCCLSDPRRGSLIQPQPSAELETGEHAVRITTASHCTSTPRVNLTARPGPNSYTPTDNAVLLHHSLSTLGAPLGSPGHLLHAECSRRSASAWLPLAGTSRSRGWMKVRSSKCSLCSWLLPLRRLFSNAIDLLRSARLHTTTPGLNHWQRLPRASSMQRLQG